MVAVETTSVTSPAPVSEDLPWNVVLLQDRESRGQQGIYCTISDRSFSPFPIRFRCLTGALQDFSTSMIDLPLPSRDLPIAILEVSMALHAFKIPISHVTTLCTN